jgi:hypothetical protein
MAEIYTQYLEATHVKHWLDNGEIIFYKRYVDYILIIYDQSKTNEQTLLHQINKVDKNLQFKISAEENNTIHYLDISIYRNSKNQHRGLWKTNRNRYSHPPNLQSSILTKNIGLQLLHK